ncbi:MAG: PAS domain-containing protein [Acidobacteria bacterium]|nr:PAS domain-containing protein [Acidobacteriota bacterium]
MRLAQNCPEPVANFIEQFAHTAEGMFAVDPQQRIIAWNQAAEALLGYSAEEVLGKYCCKIIQGRDGNGLFQCSEHCPHFEQGKRLPWVRHLDLQSRSKSGQDIWISVTTVSIISARRKLSALVHLFRQADRTDPAPAPPVGLKPSSPVGMAGLGNGSASPFPLSHREMEVLLLMAEGAAPKRSPPNSSSAPLLSATISKIFCGSSPSTPAWKRFCGPSGAWFSSLASLSTSLKEP